MRPGKSEPAPPLKAQKQPNFWSVVRQEITAVLEHNKPRIDRMSATSVEELEAIRFFENYMKTTLRGKWANQFKDTKIMNNGGFKATQGFIPSAWDTTQEQEREILRTPTVVTSDAHLLAASSFGHMTLSNGNLRILRSNIHNRQWTEGAIEKSSDVMLTSFIGNREEVLRTMSEKTQRQSLRFDMSEKKRVKFGKHLVYRFPVHPDSGLNSDLSPQKGSQEYSELSDKITIPKKQDHCASYFHGLLLERLNGIMAEGGMRPSKTNITKKRVGVYACDASENWMTPAIVRGSNSSGKRGIVLSIYTRAAGTVGQGQAQRRHVLRPRFGVDVDPNCGTKSLRDGVQ